MAETLGLYAEARQIAADLGYLLREEPLGDLPGGPCLIGGRRHVILNLERPVAERLDLLLAALAPDPRFSAQPRSRLLDARLASLGGPR